MCEQHNSCQPLTCMNFCMRPSATQPLMNSVKYQGSMMIGNLSRLNSANAGKATAGVRAFPCIVYTANAATAIKMGVDPNRVDCTISM